MRARQTYPVDQSQPVRQSAWHRVGSWPHCIQTDNIEVWNVPAAGIHWETLFICTPIEILWDGETSVAVDKPAGLPTQAPPGIPSLETVLRGQFSSRSQYVAFPHRLDRSVSGILLVALTKKSARLLSEQFASRKVDKEYRAWVSGSMQRTRESIWVDHLRKVALEPRVEVVAEDADGARRAETGVQRFDYSSELDRSLLRLFPKTGRMHQLRCQAAFRGHPIVGDVAYGGRPLLVEDRKKILEFRPSVCEEVPDVSDQITGISEHITGRDLGNTPLLTSEAILLRAHELSFHDPRRGIRVTVTASDKLGESV